MKRPPALIAVSTLGIIIIAFAVFANQLGLDHNTRWGAFRTSLLVLGILALICSAFFFIVASKLKRIFFLTTLIGTFIIAVYVWFVSVGFWTKWPSTTNYYDMLGTSFRYGQLSLEPRPNSALLDLPNPYDVQARKLRPDAFYIFDGSLYNGKFYLYWGPAPAVFLAAIKFLIPSEIGDQYIVFASVLGLFIIQSIFALKLWGRFFPDLPAWTALLGIFLCGLISPMTWMLNQPEIYEASIASGQFFLIGGLFFAFIALDNKPLPSLWQLSLAGILLSLAIASRLTLLLPVLFIAAMIILWIAQDYFRTRNLANTWKPLVALAIPLIGGAILLGWYNWARFGSVFESGLRYQLSGIDYRNHFKDIFSLSYIPANLYNYLLTPFKYIRTFPFLKPYSGDQSFALFHRVPGFYYSREKITGLLYTAPFLLFALISVSVTAAKVLEKHPNDSSGDAIANQKSLAWISIVLAGVASASFIIIMIYFYATMRFIDDFMPALVLFALIGFWQGYQSLSRWRTIQISYSILAIGLAVATIVISTVLAISGYKERFSELNPTLFHSLVVLFRP